MEPKKKEENRLKPIGLKPYTLVELSRLYGVSRLTFRVWLNKFKDRLGPRTGNYYSVAQVKIIFEHLDIPGTIEPEQ